MAATNPRIDSKVMRFSFAEYESIPSLKHDRRDIPLQPRRETTARDPEICNVGDQERKKVAIDGRRGTSFLYCIPHIIPMMVTIVLLSLNVRGVYWQDLGQTNQSSILQALQYATKAHEIMIITSLTTIVVYRIQHDISSPSGVPFGLLPAGFLFSSPNYAFSKASLGGATARSYDKGLSRYFPLSLLLLVCFALTLVVGPSSAVTMIPRLAWWDVPTPTAFGTEYTDTVFFNRTADELWPMDITNAIYANLTDCTIAWQTDEKYCSSRAHEPVLKWTAMRQNQGTPPNITIFEGDQISRFLTSEGGPPDNSSWTVTSTVGSIFATDLAHFWDWLAQNTTLPANISRPLLKPAPVDSNFQLKKPLVQIFAHDDFEFPHDELRTPPLDSFTGETWDLPNDFVMDLRGRAPSIGDESDTDHPWELFEWFDTALNFSTQGAPSLGAVIIYRSYGFVDESSNETLAACSINARWAPVEYSLDPKDTFTIRQDSPSPMEILRGPDKKDPTELTQMNMTLEWAKSMNPLHEEHERPDYPKMSAVERLLTGWGGYRIFTESDSVGKKSLDWRLSTTLGLYLTEGLALAFTDPNKASMLYRKAPSLNDSYVRYLDNLNHPRAKEVYRNGKLDWVEMQDPRWAKLSDISHEPWDVWALQNGYSEIRFSVQRNGYGYGFEGPTIKLAMTVLLIYLLLAFVHVTYMMVGGRVYRGYSTVGEMLALAWSSPLPKSLTNSTAGIKKVSTWRHIVRVREGEGGQQLQLVIGGFGRSTHSRPRTGVKYV
ncbi:MAG: hypothetical protein Q9221_005269 [Calogaya cf. arnoldii]